MRNATEVGQDTKAGPEAREQQGGRSHCHSASVDGGTQDYINRGQGEMRAIET